MNQVLAEIEQGSVDISLRGWGWQTFADPYGPSPRGFIEEKDREHWTYFLQGDDGGPVKIGSTRRDPWWRLADIQAGYPFGRLRVVALKRGHRREERLLHVRFRKWRMLGEWFELNQDLVDFIATLPRPAAK